MPRSPSARPRRPAASLVAVLRKHAQQQAADAGFLLYYFADEALRPLPRPVEEACANVVDEALLNIRRHARAARVWIRIGLAQDALLLTVRDDGAGFDADDALRRTEAGECRGLADLRDLVVLLGGTLELRTAPGQGSTLVASFPLVPMLVVENG